MVIKQEIDLREFDFWGNAIRTLGKLDAEDLKKLEPILTGMYPEWDAEELNDFFAEERDWIAEMLEYSNWNDLLDSRELDPW